jgi:DNA polymerase-3 subunit epsilon
VFWTALSSRYCARRALAAYFSLAAPRPHYRKNAYLISAKHPRMAFVDLETTGGTAATDRITEVGIIEVDEDGVREWSSLVNPQMPIPPFIQGLTGITDAMVQNAPTFDELADTIESMLAGRLFIAHNARFDHGFLKNEFKRTGHGFRPQVLCTVRLSRKLFPGFARHNLDSIVERHRLHVTERHRALGDARLLWQFWQKIHLEHSAEVVEQTVAKLVSRPSIPSKLDALQLESIPATHGVYLFYGANDLPLYVGKANDLRRRVLAHFSGDHLAAREQELCAQIERVEWRETGGEIGALLLEAALIKQLLPAFNKLLRRNDEVCSWRMVPRKGRLQAVAADTDDLFFAFDPALYGLFGTARKATDALKALADAHQLCHVLLGLEKPRAGGCFASQLGKCLGACRDHALASRKPAANKDNAPEGDGVNAEEALDPERETMAMHDQRVRAALESIRLQPWPWDGPVCIVEGEYHAVIDGWAYLGSARGLEAARALAQVGQRRFDRDVYHILQRPQMICTILAMDGTPLELIRNSM